MYRVLLSIGIIILISCSNQEVNQKQEAIKSDQENEKEELCIYSFIDSNPRIYWTAYKHSKKVAVNGQIDSAVVIGKDADNILDLIKGTSLKIFPSSVNSKDAGRDQKIRTFFFGSMKDSDMIAGSTKSVKGTNKSGTLVCSLTLNAITKDIEMAYLINENVIQLRCSIDFNNFNCDESLSKLQDACAEKHTGIDGKTLFWPAVDILIEADIFKQCD